MTSHDVVAFARRAYGERRIGHAGTLDPFATGLLILLLGRATRLLPYLEHDPKVYDATIRFGAETDTDDVTGAVVREADRPAREAIERAIAALTGTIEQTPPAYSAKQVEGRRAHAAARSGQALHLAPVVVRVHEWRVRAWREEEIDVTVTCGGGTYVRALARDLGRLAGSAAHLATLRRTASGRFSITDAHPLDVIREQPPTPRPARDAVASLPAQPIDQGDRERIGRGQRVAAGIPGERAALIDAGGELVAIAERDGDGWQPRVVLIDG